MYYNETTNVFLNGKWLRATDATAGIYGQTLHYGNGVFEGIRAYKTPDGVRIFKGEEHFERLLKSAELMHIKCSLSIDEMVSIAYDLLEKNNLSNAYIRPLIYLGENMKLAPVEEVNFFMCAWEWGQYLGSDLQSVTISPYCRPHPGSCHIEAKTVGHYTNSILASTEAKSRGFDEALLLDVNGFIAEGPGANFFFEKDSVLYTPALGQILPGITRDTVIELAKDLQIEVCEDYFKPEDLRGAESAFFVGTAAEVAGIKSIDGYTFPLNWEDSLGYNISQMYQLHVTGQDYNHFELV